MTDEKTTRANKADMTLATVLRDFWNEDGGRVRKGEIIEVDADTLILALENGTLERVK